MNHKIVIDDIVQALGDLNEEKGSLTKKIIGYIKDSFSLSDNQKRDLATQVRIALWKGVNSGLLSHCAGRYKLNNFNRGNEMEVKCKIGAKNEVLQLAANSASNYNLEPASKESANSKSLDICMSSIFGTNTFSSFHSKNKAGYNQNCTSNSCLFKENDVNNQEVWTTLPTKNYESKEKIKDMWNESANEVDLDNRSVENTIKLAQNKNYDSVTNFCQLPSQQMFPPSVSLSAFCSSPTPEFSKQRSNLFNECIKQHLFETTKDLRRTSELLELNCDKLQTKFVSPFIPGSSRHILQMPSCVYHASLTRGTPHDLICVSDCDCSPVNCCQQIQNIRQHSYNPRNHSDCNMCCFKDNHSFYNAREDGCLINRSCEKSEVADKRCGHLQSNRRKCRFHLSDKLYCTSGKKDHILKKTVSRKRTVSSKRVYKKKQTKRSIKKLNKIGKTRKTKHKKSGNKHSQSRCSKKDLMRAKPWKSFVNKEKEKRVIEILNLCDSDVDNSSNFGDVGLSNSVKINEVPESNQSGALFPGLEIGDSNGRKKYCS